MLTFAWFLAAGMKWSVEAIRGYSIYMHLIAWTLPALKTTIIMSTGSVDGDPFLGICGVGNTDIEQMHVFILAPLGIFYKMYESFFRPFSSFFAHNSVVSRQLKKL